jgi:hypothetical protein
LAKIIKGNSSPAKSFTAVAVLWALSGNQTCPAWRETTSVDVGAAGSAGAVFSMVRSSVMMTPTGMPPNRARPVTTGESGRRREREYRRE